MSDGVVNVLTDRRFDFWLGGGMLYRKLLLLGSCWVGLYMGCSVAYVGYAMLKWEASWRVMRALSCALIEVHWKYTQPYGAR